ncbi:hypothetical protein Tco_1318814 [Tanacetum coccineum]
MPFEMRSFLALIQSIRVGHSSLDILWFHKRCLPFMVHDMSPWSALPLESEELEVLEQPEQFLEQMTVDHH